MAESIGYFPLPRDGASGGAIHDGTTQPILDTSQSLLSAIGGQDMHPMEFAGPAIGLTVSGSSIEMNEENESEADGPASVPWVSHPATMGYSREGTSHTAVAPQTASGMNAGTPGDQLAELNDFGSGTDQNPSAAQSAPISRAEQVAPAPVGPARRCSCRAGPRWRVSVTPWESGATLLVSGDGPSAAVAPAAVGHRRALAAAGRAELALLGTPTA